VPGTASVTRAPTPSSSSLRPPSNPKPSNPALPRAPSNPQPSNPSLPRASSPQPGVSQASNPGVPSNPQPAQPVNPGVLAQARSPSGSGLRAPGTQHAETTFGVPPPPVRPPDYLRRPSTPPTNKPIEPAPPSGSSRTWIIIGALIAIAAGVAIALAVVG
jgi:serine/threonine-protein kinase